MPTRFYRPTVIGCVLSWFLLGLHFPLLHEIADHGAVPHWSVLAVLLVIAIASVAGLWALLREPVRGGA